MGGPDHDTGGIGALRATLESTTAYREALEDAPAIQAAYEAAATTLRAADLERLSGADRLVITGAGSSYYISQVAAAVMRAVCGLPAVAVPLSELLLRPEGVFARTTVARQPVIVVSRSGSTTEAVAVAGRVRADGHPTIAVTCRPDSDMTGHAHLTLAIPAGDERAIVMTRSFTGMLAVLLGIAARLAPDPSLRRDLDRIPALGTDRDAFEAAALRLATTRPRRVVVLGGGAYLGLANEAVLKITETSQTPAHAFEPFEFRHGPISVSEPGTLVIGLLGDEHHEVEGAVVGECEALGATGWRLAADRLGAGLHPAARTLLMLRPLQVFALALAIRAGCDPESPRHLRQVVVLPGR